LSPAFVVGGNAALPHDDPASHHRHYGQPAELPAVEKPGAVGGKGIALSPVDDIFPGQIHQYEIGVRAVMIGAIVTGKSPGSFAAATARFAAAIKG